MVALPYPVVVRPGALDELPAVLRAAGAGNRVVIITDRTVGRRYARRVGKLTGASAVMAIPPGEKHKNRKVWATLTDRLLGKRFGRDTTIVALGGGVIGDMAGFVAATYMRGVPFVQVPTTLLAMVDASIGGKTGVDTRHGKNLVGAFHQPAAVLIDPTVLATLPLGQLRAGFAEVIKHGVVADAAHFVRAVAFAPRLGDRSGLDELTALIEQSVAIKASVVTRDEREAGLRKVLNFGHTIGHALERATRFRTLHGHAVAVGMVAEARLSEQLGLGEAGTARRVEEACRLAGLPTSTKGITVAQLLRLTRTDKKARGGIVEYALPSRIGAMAGGDKGWSVAVPDNAVRAALSNPA